MRCLTLILVCLIAVAPTFNASPARAQSAPLRLLQIVTGTIGSAAPEQRWLFEAARGQRLSARMQATSGDLLPYIEVLNGAGETLARSVNSSLGSAAVEDFRVPQDGIYTLRATFAPDAPRSAGNYDLALLPGFAYLLINDPMDARSPLRRWREPNALSGINEGVLRLQVRGNNRFIVTTADALGTFRDLYVQASIQIERANRYWEAGLLIRADDKPSGLDGYILFVNALRQWCFVASQNGALSVIRDWAALDEPLGSGAFTLGLMARAERFTAYLNGQPMADFTTSAIGNAGVVGVVAGTGTRPDDFVGVAFDNLVITLPALTPGASNAPIRATETLYAWQGTPEAVMAELAEARVIPGIGRPAFRVAEAFVSNNTPGGIVFTPLASSQQFTDFVFGAEVLWDTSGEESACALGFRAPEAGTFSLFYFDRKGGYGIRQEVGGQAVAAQYDLSSAIQKGNRAVNRVVIVAVGNKLLAYINGVLVANVSNRRISGGVYLAAFNYTRISTYCRFNMVWLRSFDW